MELYERYHLMLYHAAYGILKNRDDAQDAMQEGMISAFEKLDQFKGEGDFGAWIRKIVVRKSIAYYRHNKRFVDELQFENHIELSESSEDDPNNFPSINSVQLTKAMAKLNHRYGLILKLYYLEGFTHMEISDLLQCNYDNCRTILSRAKAQLKKKIE
ncbi:MAG: RNA polymerase sigma factor [Flavobacteriaceae bacterium]|nr:RNA polymerase sigma factor [Flavobacteriaceae bacterium]